MSDLGLERLEKRFPDGTHAVRGVDLALAAGRFAVLLGPSGCGKTTTLRMVAGLEQASGGRVLLGGRDVTALRPAQRDIGFVFQFYALYPHLCVRENVAFPLRCAGASAREARARVEGLAERLGFTALLDQRPRQLSGGDQQRVALARAMVRRPALWLMDEPLGTLDGERRLELREFLRGQQQELGVTTLYVTHDQEEAMALADLVVVMRAGEVLQAGTPAEVYDRPRHRFVAGFVGSPGMNFLAGEVVGEGSARRFRPRGESLELALAPGALRGPALLGVRPEALRPDMGGLPARVRAVEYMGDRRQVHLDAAGGRVVMRADARARFAPGEALRVGFEPVRALLYDETSGGLLE